MIEAEIHIQLRGQQVIADDRHAAVQLYSKGRSLDDVDEQQGNGWRRGAQYVGQLVQLQQGCVDHAVTDEVQRCRTLQLAHLLV